MNFIKIFFIGLIAILIIAGGVLFLSKNRKEESSHLTIPTIEKKVEEPKIEDKKEIKRELSKDVNKSKIEIKENKPKKIDKVINYSGKYLFGYEDKNSDGPRGVVDIIHKKNRIKFSFELDGGAPNFNIGELEGEVELKDNVAVFKGEGSYKRCKIIFKFKNGIIDIQQKGTSGDCGFGMGVVATGEYKREINIIHN